MSYFSSGFLVLYGMAASAANYGIENYCQEIASAAICERASQALGVVQEVTTLAVKISVTLGAVQQIFRSLQGIREATHLPPLPLQHRRNENWREGEHGLQDPSQSNLPRNRRRPIEGGAIRAYRPQRTIGQKGIEIAKKALPCVISLVLGYQMQEVLGVSESVQSLAHRAIVSIGSLMG